jgi:hypothetical protein
VLVAGDGKRFEPSLIHVPHATRAVMGVPALSVRDGQPTEKLRNRAIFIPPGPDDEVPMVAHDDVSENPQRHAPVRFGDDRVECGEIGILLEQPQSAIGPIENVVDISADKASGSARHPGNISATTNRVKK